MSVVEERLELQPREQVEYLFMKFKAKMSSSEKLRTVEELSKLVNTEISIDDCFNRLVQIKMDYLAECVFELFLRLQERAIPCTICSLKECLALLLDKVYQPVQAAAKPSRDKLGKFAVFTEWVICSLGPKTCLKTLRDIYFSSMKNFAGKVSLLYF
jgi:hypothetical protein